ncbi:MAG: V-type ATP synthase subunit D [Bacteroidota bacterium]|nr:V-type ATP synthase subunit D [uncultured Allomuricauda sp.]
MADRILMNKNTLAAFKAELKGYQTAFPVFEMKEQQLKEMVQVTENHIARLNASISETELKTRAWVSVMAEETVDLSQMVQEEEIITEKREIAGVSIDVFQEVSFSDKKVDLLNTPLWIDAALEVIQDQKIHRILLKMEENNLTILSRELSEARRMKNALKEVFIPDTKENIRKIEIYLGDVERLAIGCAKLVKKKKESKKAVA